MERSSIYLDHNATTAPMAEALAHVPRWLEAFGNASSIHWAGRPSKQLLRESRRELAEMLGCEPIEIVFTSGGSEANNLALKGILFKQTNSHRKELIISSIEHPSIMKTADVLKKNGYPVHVISVSRETGIDMNAFRAALSERTALVSIMFANNETGSVFPIRELSDLAHEAGALFHCDAVQGLGKAEIDLDDLGVDLASFSGHKFYAFKGVGALFVRRGVSLESLIHGGGQERGRRAGTENILAIASLGHMASKGAELPAKIESMRALRDRFETLVLERIPDVQIVGRRLPRICNTSSLYLESVDGETLLMNLDVLGFAVSTGAACSSGNPEPSPVLLAMGLTRSQAQSSLRVSVGWRTTEAEIDRFVDALASTVDRLRKIQAVSGV